MTYGVLVAVEADLSSSASNLEASSLSLASSCGRDLDVVVGEWRTDEAVSYVQVSTPLLSQDNQLS